MTGTVVSEEAPAGVSLEEGMLELSLLLSIQQMSQMEMAARRRGLTVGNLFRRLIDGFLTRETLSHPAPSEEGQARPW